MKILLTILTTLVLATAAEARLFDVNLKGTATCNDGTTDVFKVSSKLSTIVMDYRGGGIEILYDGQLVTLFQVHYGEGSKKHQTVYAAFDDGPTGDGFMILVVEESGMPISKMKGTFIEDDVFFEDCASRGKFSASPQ